MSSGTKKSLESARPKKRASSSEPESSAARVEGPTPCAPGTVSILPAAARCGDGTEGAVAEGAEDGIEARAKNVGREPPFAPRVDAPFPPATWTPTCPPPIGASPAPSPMDAFPPDTWPPPIGASPGAGDDADANALNPKGSAPVVSEPCRDAWPTPPPPPSLAGAGGAPSGVR